MCASGEACGHCSGMQKQLKLTWQLVRHQSEGQTQERGRWAGCTCPSAFSGCHLRDLTVSRADSRSVGPSTLQAACMCQNCTHPIWGPRGMMGQGGKTHRGAMAGKVEQEAVSCSRLAAVPGERLAQGGGGGGAVPGLIHHRDVRSRHREVLLQHLRERGRILRRRRKRLGSAYTTAAASGKCCEDQSEGREAAHDPQMLHMHAGAGGEWGFGPGCPLLALMDTSHRRGVECGGVGQS